MTDEKRIVPRPPSEPTDAVRLEFMDPNGQRVWALYANDETAAPPPESDFSLFLKEIPAILRRQKRLMLLCAIAAGCLGVVYLLVADSVFGASAEILVERRGSALGEFNRVTTANTAFLATQAEVIHSRAIVEPALESLPFALTDDPEVEPVLHALEALSVTPVHGTDVVAIHYRGEDARKGVALIAAALDQYRNFIQGVEFSGHSEAVELLREREEGLRSEIAALEQEYHESVRRSGALGAERSSDEVDREVLSVHAQRAVDAENLKRDLEGELRSLRASLANDRWFSPGPLSDPHLVQLLSEANSELALLRVSNGPSHPDTLDSERRIRVLKQQIVQQLESSVSRARRDASRMRGVFENERDTRRSNDVERSMQERLQSEIAQLSQTRAQALGALADKELTVGALGRSGVQVRVIEPPRVAPDRIWPRAELVMIPCLALGAIGGALIAIARDRYARAPHVSVARSRSGSEASLGRALVHRDEPQPAPPPFLEEQRWPGQRSQ